MRTTDPRLDQDALYYLLPEVYRQRDAGENFPLRDLLRVLSEQVAVVQEDVARLYDDAFIETCSPWIVAYIADLIGLRGVPGGNHPLAGPVRAEVANTIRYRRRKGTVPVLEDLAFATTGWPARAVEFFELLATTQHLNHVRRQNHSYISVRRPLRMEQVNTAFERDDAESDPADITHTLDVRRIGAPPGFRQGRYNIPNIGVFLWRLRAFSRTQVPATPISNGYFWIDPSQGVQPLFHGTQPEQDVTTLAGPLAVPASIGRRRMQKNFPQIYGAENSVALFRQSGQNPPTIIPLEQVAVRCLDTSATNALTLSGTQIVAIDPVRGLIAFDRNHLPSPGEKILVTYAVGGVGEIGGGEYARLQTFVHLPSADARYLPVASEYIDQNAIDLNHPPFPTLNAAIATLPASGNQIIEILDNGVYGNPSRLNVLSTDGRTVEIRATEGCIPTLRLGSLWEITGGTNDTVILNGFHLYAGKIRVSGSLGSIILRHCTLYPGMSHALEIEGDATRVTIERCIIGGIHLQASRAENDVRLVDTIVHPGLDDFTRIAIGGGGGAYGGSLTLENVTILGRIRARRMELASNSLFMGVVETENQQSGCVRYSYIYPDSRTPRQFNCIPNAEVSDEEARPQFDTTDIRSPRFARLSLTTTDAVLRGADEEGEMGAWHFLANPQRTNYLRHRLEDYLRMGREVGLIWAD